ncbi:MAG: hypothetical protein RDV48_16230 [Candidatus Eremiobacteraeota bacterium]|nr:hypothetical protein [Candidatus Eremiobacteraeota bacterium]
MDAVNMKPVMLSQTATPQKASDLKKMADAPAEAEPKDTVEKNETGFWADVKASARKGADISSHALGGFTGLTLAGLGIYVGALGGALGGAYLGGGLGLLKAAASSKGFLGFWGTAFNTSTAIGKAGILAGGASVGYGSWQLGKGVGSVVAAIPGALIGGAVGVGIAIRNKLTGDGGE